MRPRGLMLAHEPSPDQLIDRPPGRVRVAVKVRGGQIAVRHGTIHPHVGGRGALALTDTAARPLAGVRVLLAGVMFPAMAGPRPLAGPVLAGGPGLAGCA